VNAKSRSVGNASVWERKDCLARATASRPFEIAIIGGGINGCGIARDAAGRGWSVFLCEQGDLASATSSASTKLIHGGLRYLEYYEFRLVREALLERETLWKIAPHIIWPIRFVLPYHRGLRPAWLLRLGLFLYDHLGGRSMLPPTKSLDLTLDPAGRPLKADYVKGFEYSDCWVDDARLVVLNARDAADRGAVIAPRTRCLHARRQDGHWVLTLQDQHSGLSRDITAHTLVNAAGPWAGEVTQLALPSNTAAPVRLVKGSHIVVPRLFEHERSYIFQNADGRILFAIPYEHAFTLIGTTDVDYVGDPAQASASPEEIAYLCEAASDYFKVPVGPDLVTWAYSGVRPLYDDGASEARAATRDYVIKLNAPDGLAPLACVYGGKITTYRRLAQSVLAQLADHLPPPSRSEGWTGQEPLPGGDFPAQGFDDQVKALHARYPFLADATARRLVRAYGTLALRILGKAQQLSDLGRAFGADLTEAELRYLVAAEWATTAQDVVFRRSKLGLFLQPAEIEEIDDFMTTLHAAPETLS
jgi:glycerol-3-phosphate dehydrogenase